MILMAISDSNKTEPVANHQTEQDTLEISDFEDHTYTVVHAKDLSIPAKQRQGGIWYIVSAAASKKGRVYTLIQAAEDLFSEMANPSPAVVWLYPSREAAENGLAIVGKAFYVPDGKGRESGFLKDAVWNLKVSDYQHSDLQKQIQTLWIANRENYLN